MTIRVIIHDFKFKPLGKCYIVSYRDVGHTVGTNKSIRPHI